MGQEPYIDVTRFGWGGQGTKFVTIGAEVPMIGTVQLGVAWNKDQVAIIGSGAANLAIPSLLEGLKEGVFNGGGAGLTAWEVFESFKTIKAVREDGRWENVTALSSGVVNGYVEDLAGEVDIVGANIVAGGINLITPVGYKGGIADWFHKLPGAGYEIQASGGVRINVFREGTSILHQFGPSRIELEVQALENVLDAHPNLFAPPPDIWEYVNPCFAAGTPILLADGTSRVIEDIVAGDSVAAFNETDSQGRGKLRAANVARLLPGITEEWIVLEDTSSARLRQDTRVTPGHRYLTEHGTWMAAADLIASDVRAVAADGSLVPLRGTLLRASDAGSDAEWITPEPFADAGNLVQPAPVFGWRTYNFEVAELHTYVAANDNCTMIEEAAA